MTDIFSKPPYEFDMARFDESSAWPGNYRDYNVQCAWDGFHEARERAIPSAQPTPSDPKGWMAKLNAGAQLANVAFNWAQRCGYTLTSDDCAMLDKLRKQWDAAPNPIPTGGTAP